MVVIGIDFGNDSCVVSVWRNGRIETVTNEFNDRYTPSMVAFSQRKRDIGLSAKKLWCTNVANTIFDFKTILNVNLTKRWKFNLLKFTENAKDQTLTFEITISGRKLKFTSCQVLAMLLAKIKADAQVFLQSNERIVGCVIAVPLHFNDRERKAVLMAAAIARLDCHFLIKETTAVAINYALYKKFTTPVNVIFIDFGQSSIQISACRFSDRQLEVIEEVSALIGGRDIDEKLADFFIDAFKIHGANKSSKIFGVQLLHEVEVLKKKMSTSVERLPLNIKQLFNCEPIFMARTEMEKVCSPLFVKIEELMRLCLDRSKLNVDEIRSIELVGGSSRIPIIETLVEKVFGKRPIATMNRDDAVARGCFLRSVLNMKRRGFKIKEKPFTDDTNYNRSCSGMKELVRVFQVHRYLKCDCRDAFNVTENEFMDYVEVEKKLTQSDLDEEQRQIARNKLDTYLIEHMKREGVLENSSPETTKELTDIRMWHDGTKDQYLDLLHYWTQKVEKIKKRKLREQLETVEDNDWVTIHKIELQSDADQVFDRKITFQDDCDNVLPNERNRSSITKSGGQSSKTQYRRGSRRRRLNHNVQESRDTEFANSQIHGSQRLLLSGQRKTAIKWCCFL